MKQSSNKFLRNIIYTLTLVAIFVFLIYGIIYKFPSIFRETITKIEKDVNVTDEGIADAVAKVYDSIVEIKSDNEDNYFTSTGFIYKEANEKTYVICSSNNILKGSDYKIILSDGREYKGELLEISELYNFAIFKISKNNFTIAETDNIDNIRVGDAIFNVYSNIDNEYNWNVLRGVISSNGYISKINNYDQYLFSTDILFNHKNTTGILCNSNGDIIGLSIVIDNQIFGIPVENIIERVEIMLDDNLKISDLGISIVDLRKINNNKVFQDKINSIKIARGLYVLDIYDNQNNFFEKGDIIFKINNKKIETPSSFRSELINYKKGDKVTFSLYREDSIKEITIEL